MYSVRIVRKNITWLQASWIVTNLSSGFLGILVVRYLGSQDYGLFATAVVVATVFAVFLDFGFSELMVREGSRRESEIRSHLGSSLLAYSLLGVVCYITMAGFACMAHYSQGVVLLIMIYGIGTFSARGWQIWQAIFRIQQRLDLHAKLEIGAALLRASLLAAFLLFRLGLVALVSIHAAVSVLFFGLHIVIGKRFYRPTLDFTHTLRCIRPAVPFGISAALFFFYRQTDVLMLSLMSSPEIIGAYAAVYRLIILLYELPLIVFNKTLLPTMFRSYKDNPQELKKIYATGSRYMLGLGVLFSFFLYFYAKTIVLTLFGQSYEHAALALRILAFGVPLRYLSAGAEATLTAVDRMKDKVMAQGAVALLNVALNLILIPAYSLNGAAVASLISEGVLLVLLLERTRRHFAGLSIRRDLQLGRLFLVSIILFGLATLAHGRISDYLMVPFLILISPFVLRLSRFLDWKLDRGR